MASYTRRMSRLATRAVSALDDVITAKDGNRRQGQAAMTEAVADAIEDRHHLLVEAGTGTGKSLAYLVPALLSGERVVVATATKTLQDQLADAELPLLADVLDTEVTWAVLKGRQSYACMAKLGERFGGDLKGSGTPELFPDSDIEALREVATWAASHPTGDRDDLPAAVSDALWREASVSGMECPGAKRCAQGPECRAERAAQRARAARVVVTNHHLYALHLASGGRILPSHGVTVFDEAHKLEAAVASAFGIDMGPGRLTSFANNAARLVRGRDKGLVDAVRETATEMDKLFRDLPEARLDPGAGDVGSIISRATKVVGAAAKQLGGDEGPVARVKTQGGHLLGDAALALGLPSGYVAWAEPARAALRLAPVEVAESLGRSVLVHHPVILTSATLTTGGSFVPVARRTGFVESSLDPDPLAEDVDEPLPRTYRGLRVESSFDYSKAGLLYVASHLPDPRQEAFGAAATAEIELLLEAAGGRALVLTTSHRMVDTIAAGLGSTHRILVQGQLPKKRLIAEFAGDERSVLVATMGYWEGIDVPGSSLSLVIIDKLPFPRPGDPLFDARRDAVTARGGDPFNEIDLPHAAMLVAQGAGRLIRGEDDRGVVALLDHRVTSKRYGQRILRSLPRLLRTSDRERAVRFLRSLRPEAAGVTEG